MKTDYDRIKNLERPNRSWKIRLINSMGGAIEGAGIPLTNLSEEKLLSAAQSKTGLSDWGDDSFRVPLRIFLESLHKDANLNFLGRMKFEKHATKLLVNRLRIQEDFKCYPEILQVPIRRPLFVTGLPRTGTTLLHNLLSQDPANRTLRLWEILSPSPPPELQNRDSDPRIEKAKKSVEKLNSLAPQLGSAHYLNPTGPEECNSLFEHEFISILFELHANIPTYSQWLESRDMVGVYQSYRKQLQLLSWRCPAVGASSLEDNRWVLKAPAHLFYLDALLAVFPDACIVQTHRDPLQVLPSFCSLSAIMRGINTDRVDPLALGNYWLNRLANGALRGMQVRENANPAQFYDLHYKDLLEDPIGAVSQIYQYFGYPFSELHENNMKQWLAENPQHKHGIHRYSLEQFGLEPDLVNERFAQYRQRFNLGSC